MEKMERNIQVDPETGKRKRGRPRGSGRLQKIMMGTLPKVEVNDGVLTVLQVHVVANPFVEKYLLEKQVRFIEITGRSTCFVLLDGSKMML